MQFKASIACALALALGSFTALCAGSTDGGIYPDNLVAAGGYPGGPYAEGGYPGGGYAGGGYSGGAYAGGGYAGGGYAVGGYAVGTDDGVANQRGEIETAVAPPPRRVRRDVDGKGRRIEQQRDQRDQSFDRGDRDLDRRHDQLERREEERVKREQRLREPRVHPLARERFDDRLQRRARDATPVPRVPRPNHAQDQRRNENSGDRRGYAPGDRD